MENILNQKILILFCLGKYPIDESMRREIIRMTWTESEIDIVVYEKFKKFVARHPDKPWDQYYIANNPDTPISVITDMPSMPYQSSIKSFYLCPNI